MTQNSTPQEIETYLKRAGFSDVRIRTDDDWIRASGIKPELFAKQLILRSEHLVGLLLERLTARVLSLSKSRVQRIDITGGLIIPSSGSGRRERFTSRVGA